uniref:NAD(P)H-binding protein n=1 Tax=Roseovarius indicus TaxID=540747 RepID=UPI003B524088
MEELAERSGQRVLLLGATGTIGRAVLGALREAGHKVVCFVRDGAGLDGEVRVGDVSVPGALAQAIRGERFDAVVSCMASRTGAPEDAWAVDYAAHMEVLAAAQAAGIGRFVLLSAICVQRPKLEFQRAKMAFEEALAGSGLGYSIVRPTAYFKSLSGQLDRVRAGKPFLLFGDGRLTACKPISDGDLGRFIAGCLVEPDRFDRVLPIGGPGPAVAPVEMGERLFELTGETPRFKHVPVGMMDAIVGGLSLAGRVSGRMRAKAELARIGRYYATESMLVWDEGAGRYSAEQTPEFGEETLFDFYERLVRGEVSVDRGDHAVF